MGEQNAFDHVTDNILSRSGSIPAALTDYEGSVTFRDQDGLGVCFRFNRAVAPAAQAGLIRYIATVFGQSGFQNMSQARVAFNDSGSAPSATELALFIPEAALPVYNWSYRAGPWSSCAVDNPRAVRKIVQTASYAVGCEISALRAIRVASERAKGPQAL